MKKLSLLAVLLLAGCGTMLDAYLMKYDPNEYMMITGIRTAANQFKTTCTDTVQSKSNAAMLHNQTILFKNYVQYLPHNDKVIDASKELDKIAEGLTTQYQKGTVSLAFCKIKFESIEKSAETMQRVIGDKPR